MKFIYYSTPSESLDAALELAQDLRRRVWVFQNEFGYYIDDTWRRDYIGYAYPGGRKVWAEKKQ